MPGDVTPLWVSLLAWLVLRGRPKKLYWVGLVTILFGIVSNMGGDMPIGMAKQSVWAWSPR
jgi:drug/metabolite transporter (DMT)-like permease